MKRISIEDLLIWAFTAELPKVGARTVSVPGFTPSDAMAQMIELGTSIDKSPNDYGVIGGYVFEGDPHPDAIIVGDAVRQLVQREGYDIDMGWNPFPEWNDEHGLIALEVARVARSETGRGGRVNGQHVVNLVTTAAILKRGPDWKADEPKTAMVLKSGRPAWFVKRVKRDDRTGRSEEMEDEGFDVKRQRPKKNAYRKYRLTTSIRAAIIDRLEWQLWQDALATLADSLTGKLRDHQISTFMPDRAPWTRVSIRERKILTT